MATKPRTPGPEADRLKLAGDWKEAVAKALGKKRPEGGWPKPESRFKPREKQGAANKRRKL